jgi:hypothetical protein
MYNRWGKENTEGGEDVKGTYILLSGILAVVVTSLLSMVLQAHLLYTLDVVYIQNPSLFCMTIAPPPCICINARMRYYPFFSWMIYAMQYITICFE